MPLNTLGLFAGIAVARRENVAPENVARVALPAAIFPNLALGVIIVDRLAKQEAAAEAAATPTPTPPPATGGPRAVAIGAGAATAGGTGTAPVVPLPIQYPSVSLQPAMETYEPGQVLVVDPGQWAQVPADENPRFQWFSARNEAMDDAEDIDGAEKSTYEIREGDLNKWLAAQVTYKDPDTGQDVSTTSAPIRVGPPPDEDEAESAAEKDAEGEKKARTP
jgi:hypothetical protein